MQVVGGVQPIEAYPRPIEMVTLHQEEMQPIQTLTII